MALLPGCDRNGAGTANGPKQKKLRLAFVANTASEYWSMVNVGCVFAAKQVGDIDLEFHCPTDRTPEAQQQLLTDLVAQGLDGVAVSPIDADKQTEFLKSIASKTLLVCADSDAENSGRVCYIGSDNVAAGEKVAELLKAALPQGGKIVLLVGYPNAQNTRDRVAGIQNGLTGSNLRIIETQADEHKSPIAQQNAQEALAKHPDLAGLVGIYSYHGPAMLAAVRSADKAGQVKIVCFDEDADTMAGIAAGDIFGTIVQRPLVIGAQTIRRMAGYLRGDKSQLAGGKVLIPVQAITTEEEVADFQARRRGLLQPEEE
jgi:ribose transport system substrate-binding protein